MRRLLVAFLRRRFISPCNVWAPPYWGIPKKRTPQSSWLSNQPSHSKPPWVLFTGLRSEPHGACAIWSNSSPPPPSSWELFLSMWLQVLHRWSSHPQPSLPADETQLLHQAIKQLKETGHLQHPRVQQVGSRSPPKLHRPRRKKRKKELYAAQMAESHKVLVDKYRQAGWEIIYTDGSPEDHPTVGRVGGYGVYFGDARDTATHIPREEPQANNRGELRVALHAVQYRNKSKQTLICSDSLLVVQGITGKAHKWRRHDWQGSARPVGHVDLWNQRLHETESQGTAIQWLHVPSHIGVDGNTHADWLADIGRRRSPPC